MKLPIGPFTARRPGGALALVGLLLLATAHRVSAEDRKGDPPGPVDRARLQGTWKMTQWIMGGEPMDPRQLAGEAHFWVIRGDRLTAHSKGPPAPPEPLSGQEPDYDAAPRIVTEYTFELDSTKTPTTLTLIDEKNRTRRTCICRVDGDALTVCFDTRREKPVPKDFESPTRTLVKLWTFVRMTDRP